MNQDEINRVKHILGNHYSVKIVKHLTAIGILNADGNAFSSGAIRKIVNGFQPNDEVELEILKLTAKVEKKQAAIAKKRKALTENL